MSEQNEIVPPGSIRNMTNGKKSSEFALASVSLVVASSLGSIAIALNYITPEHAAAINQLVIALFELLGWNVAAYAAGRSIIKSVIAYQQGQYEPVETIVVPPAPKKESAENAQQN